MKNTTLHHKNKGVTKTENAIITRNRFDTLFNAMKRGVIFLDKQLSITDANPAALKVMGITSEQAEGLSILDICWNWSTNEALPLAPDHHPAFITLRNRVESRGVTLGVVNQVDGVIRWIKLSTFLECYGPGEQPSGVIAVFEDITQQRKIIGELKKSEEKYRGFIDNALVGVYQSSDDGELLYANEALSRMLGFSSQFEMMKSNSGSFFPDARSKSAFLLKLRDLAGRLDNFETEFVTRDGNRISVLLSARQRENTISGMVVDITGRKLAEEETLRGKEDLSALIENKSFSIWSVNTRFEILTMNSFFRDECQYLFGCIAEIGASFLDLLPNDKKALWELNLGKAFSGQTLVFEITHMPEDQQRYWEVSINPVWHHGKVAGASVFSVETTEKRKAAEAIRQNEDRLEALLRLHQKKDLPELEIIQFALDTVVKFTNSTIGYLHFVNEETATINLVAWSSETLNKCDVEKTSHYPVSEAGVWVEPFYTRKPAFQNNYKAMEGMKGFPVGNISLERHLGIPLLDGNRLVAVAGVGNKSEDYSESDVRQMTVFLNNMWGILKSGQAEKALKESEEIYRSFVQNFKGVAFRTTINWDPIFFHGSLQEMTGYAEEELLGRNPNWKDIILPPDRELLFYEYPSEVFRKAGFFAEREYRIVRKGGDVIWVHDIIHVQSNEDGEPTFINGAVFDITERKQTEEELETIFNISADMICIASLDGYFLKINPAFFKILGYTQDELLNRPFIDFVIEEDKENTVKVLSEELRTGKTVINFQNRFRCKDGAVKWLDWNSRPVPEINMTFSVARDITAYKAAEAGIQAVMGDLERSNAELEQFAYVASHDLQEPLRKVKSFSELLANRYRGQLDEKANKYIDYITSGVTRMQTLINDLLQLSRVTTRGRDFQQTDLNRVWGQAIENLEILVNESRAIIKSDNLPVLLADEMQMLQLLQNLLSNAIKFRKDDVVPEVRITVKDKIRYWEFAVSDNGIGLNMQYAQRIFVIFQRLHTMEEYRGTGIGLAICKRIVERHGGEISVISAPGKGARFIFTIKKFN